MFNKKIIAALILCSIFIIGFQLVETVNAASWKKFDSGNYKIEAPSGFKNKTTYTSYIKDSKNIKMNIYTYQSKDNKKIYSGTLYISKTGNKIKTYTADAKGKKEKPDYYKTNYSAKKYYNLFISHLKNS